jgi:hypothetical protein
MMSIQEAKEYSIEINLARRHLNDFQSAKWAIEVYTPKANTDAQIAAKVGLDRTTIGKSVSLLNALTTGYNSDPQKMSEYSNKLQNGEIGIRTALKELEAASTFDKATAEIKDKTFREEMEVKYANSKYNPVTLKKLEKDITVHDHPERFSDEQKYYESVQRVVSQGRKLEEAYEDNVAIMTIAVPEDYKECSKWITEQARQNRGFTCVCFFYLPEEMVKKTVKGSAV